MKNTIIIAIAALSLTACGVNHQAGKRVVESHGFTDVVIGGYAFFSCGKDEFASSFTAKDANGNPVSGAICSGWFKGYTVRLH